MVFRSLGAGINFPTKFFSYIRMRLDLPAPENHAGYYPIGIPYSDECRLDNQN